MCTLPRGSFAHVSWTFNNPGKHSLCIEQLGKHSDEVVPRVLRQNLTLTATLAATFHTSVEELWKFLQGTNVDRLKKHQPRRGRVRLNTWLWTSVKAGVSRNAIRVVHRHSIDCSEYCEAQPKMFPRPLVQNTRRREPA